MVDPLPTDPSKRFRKRPVEVEAWQWNGVCHLDHAPAWVQKYRAEIWNSDRSMRIRHRIKPELGFMTADWLLMVPTLEGNMYANPGDWIIKGVKGEVYPCKPDIFEATYEPA